MTMHHFIAAITENTWILLATQAVIAFGMLIKAWVDANNRVQDRLDAESKAKILAAGLEEVKNKGREREERIVKQVAVVEAKADAAYEAGNGNQVKFAAVTARLEEHSKALLTPTEVTVVNDAKHPVHVTKS